MTRAEWDEWVPRQMASYAGHIAASGAMGEGTVRHGAPHWVERSFGC